LSKKLTDLLKQPVVKFVITPGLIPVAKEPTKFVPMSVPVQLEKNSMLGKKKENVKDVLVRTPDSVTIITQKTLLPVTLLILLSKLKVETELVKNAQKTPSIVNQLMLL